MGKWPENPVSVSYFTDEIIGCEDLDPVYCALTDANLPDDVLKPLLLAYWCYYSVGTACRIVEPGPDKFYDMMWRAHHEKWPHGFERRYFYGDMAHNTIKHLEEFGSPEAVVDHMTAHDEFNKINQAVMSHYGFGSWMGWKIADMSERVLCYDVDFSQCNLGIYRDPVMGAALLLYGEITDDIEPDDLKFCCDVLDVQFKHHKAPPFYDRSFNVQEGETILCKYKAYFKGEYYLGKDILEVGEGLEMAHHLGCDLAQHIHQCMPPPYEQRMEPYGQSIEHFHDSVLGLNYPIACSTAAAEF